MTEFDIIDDPRYEPNGLSVSTTNDRPKRGTRLDTLKAYWAVYYHGRALHDHLHVSEVHTVRQWYADGLPSTDPQWQMITTPGKQPSPSTDHRRRAGLES